ncbi:MAG: PTS sugar transporter subunit IIA [Anaerolineae bacterium]
MLSDHLCSRCIRLHVAVKNWEEAVRLAGGLLEEIEACEPRYTEAMINAVRELGPYMVLAPGLALLHARPEDGVKHIALSLVTLDPPVSFGSERNDPVSLVIAFGAVDKEKHLNMLQELALFLDHPTHRQQLMTATSVDEVMALMDEL